MPAGRVLIVEDEDDLRAVWEEALEAAGYDAVGIGSAADALARLPEVAPELILLDMTMPGMDGFEFLARLRAHPVSSRIPVLIVSALGHALGQAIDRRAAETLGVAGVLPKPVDVSTLVGHVRRVIGPAGEPPHRNSP